MDNLFLCLYEDIFKPVKHIATIMYEQDQSIGKSIYYDINNGNILTRYFEISIKRGKKRETMIMQDSPYGYDLSQTPYLPVQNKKNIDETISKEALKLIKEKLTFTQDEIKKLNEYRFGYKNKKRYWLK